MSKSIFDFGNQPPSDGTALDQPPGQDSIVPLWQAWKGLAVYVLMMQQNCLSDEAIHALDAATNEVGHDQVTLEGAIGVMRRAAEIITAIQAGDWVEPGTT